MRRVAAIQLKIYNETESILEKIILACSAKSEIVCLPECWYSVTINDMENELNKIIDISNKYDVCIIAGAFIENVKNELYISAPVIFDGKIVGKQYKIYPYSKENKSIKRGNKLNVFEYKGIRFGIAICHDIVFPEISRILAKKGADMIFYPSKIRNEGIEPWLIYLNARALENRIVAIAPNIYGDLFGGKSTIVDIVYNKEYDIAKTEVTQATSQEQILVSDIDIDRIRVIREERLNELRDDYILL